MKNLNTQLMTESLKKIVQTCGTDTFKNAARFRSAIEDLLPGFEYKVERITLNMCVQVGIGEQLLLAKSEYTNDGKLRIKDKAIQVLTEDYSLANERAELVVKCFTEALDIDFDRGAIFIHGDLMSRLRPLKRITPVFFVVDTSGHGRLSCKYGIGDIIKYTIQQLENRCYYDCDNEVQFAILTFGGKVNWVTGNHSLVKAEQCCLQELSFGGPAQLAAAFYELDTQLSRHGILHSLRGCMRPNLILLNSSSITRSRDELEKSLNKLKKNGWYKFSKKIAIGYGDSVDDDIMLEFVDGVYQNCINISKSTEIPSDWLHNKIEVGYFADDDTFYDPFDDDLIPVGRCSTMLVSGKCGDDLAVGTNKAAEEIANILAAFEPPLINSAYDLDEEW